MIPGIGTHCAGRPWPRRGQVAHIVPPPHNPSERCWQLCCLAKGGGLSFASLVLHRDCRFVALVPANGRQGCSCCGPLNGPLPPAISSLSTAWTHSAAGSGGLGSADLPRTYLVSALHLSDPSGPDASAVKGRGALRSGAAWIRDHLIAPLGPALVASPPWQL